MGLLGIAGDKLGRSAVLVCTNSASFAIFIESLDSTDDPLLNILVGFVVRPGGKLSGFVGEKGIAEASFLGM